MTTKETTKVTYSFQTRSVAVECVRLNLEKENVEELCFSEKVWLSPDSEDRFEVTIKFKTVTR